MPTGTIKISEFLLKAATTGDEYFPIVDAGENKRATLSTALDGYSPTGHTHANYITGFTESDPVFAAASGNFAALNHLHTGVYSTTGHTHTNYITGFTETDPVFAAASGNFSAKHINIATITGTTHTLVIGNDDAFLRLTNASGCVVTIPLYSSVAFDEGSCVTFQKTTTGTVYVTGVSTGVTIQGDNYMTDDAYSVFQALNVGENVWTIIGGTTA